MTVVIIPSVEYFLINLNSHMKEFKCIQEENIYRKYCYKIDSNDDKQQLIEIVFTRIKLEQSPPPNPKSFCTKSLHFSQEAYIALEPLNPKMEKFLEAYFKMKVFVPFDMGGEISIFNKIAFTSSSLLPEPLQF